MLASSPLRNSWYLPLSAFLFLIPHERIFLKLPSYCWITKSYRWRRLILLLLRWPRKVPLLSLLLLLHIFLVVQHGFGTVDTKPIAFIRMSIKLNGVNYPLGKVYAQHFRVIWERLTHCKTSYGFFRSITWRMAQIKFSCFNSLLNSIEPEITSTVTFFDTTKEVWDSLATTYAPQETICHVYRLYEEIFTMKQEESSL